jgi:hypothetical protein
MFAIHKPSAEHARHDVVATAVSALRRAAALPLQRLSDRREARKIAAQLRRMDASMLYDIGFRELREEVGKAQSTLPRAVILAVRSLF